MMFQATMVIYSIWRSKQTSIYFFKIS